MLNPAPKVVPTGYQLSPDYVAAGYPRPKGATPFRVPLVPAYAQCTGGNRQHGPPLAFSSCNPPQQTSSQLTVGTPDANGRGRELGRRGAGSTSWSATRRPRRTRPTCE